MTCSSIYGDGNSMWILHFVYIGHEFITIFQMKAKMAVEGDTSSKKAALDYSFLKGFAAGVVFSHINKRLILGLVAGTLTGAYIQQNYEGIPNVEDMAKRFVQSIRDAMNEKKP